MPAWNEHAGNLTRDEIDEIVGYIRGWESQPAQMGDINAGRGDATRGRTFYQGLCSNCHGRDGKGGIGNALNSLTFLAVATDEFLSETIVNGRPGTAMASWKHLPREAVNDILAHVRGWETRPPDFPAVQAGFSDLPRSPVGIACLNSVRPHLVTGICYPTLVNSMEGLVHAGLIAEAVHG